MQYHQAITAVKGNDPLPCAELSSKSVQSAADREPTGVVIPPGCDHPALHHCGEIVTTYTPASYRPFSSASIPAPSTPHAMHGKIGGISVPKDEGGIAQRSMTEYLNQFRGAQLCLDLWIGRGTKIKKCGILFDVGKDFLVLRDTNGSKITLIDLKPVRYINLYCK